MKLVRLVLLSGAAFMAVVNFGMGAPDLQQLRTVTPHQRAQQLPQEAQGDEFADVLRRLEEGDPKAWEDYKSLYHRSQKPNIGGVLKMKAN